MMLHPATASDAAIVSMPSGMEPRRTSSFTPHAEWVAEAMRGVKGKDIACVTTVGRTT